MVLPPYLASFNLPVDDLEAFLEKEMMLIDLGIASPGLCAILSAQAPNSVPESTTAFAMVEDMMGAGDRPPAAPGPQSSTASEMVPDTMAAANRIPATLQADKVSESAKKTRKPRKPLYPPQPPVKPQLRSVVNARIVTTPSFPGTTNSVDGANFAADFVGCNIVRYTFLRNRADR